MTAYGLRKACRVQNDTKSFFLRSESKLLDKSEFLDKPKILDKSKLSDKSKLFDKSNCIG